MDPHPIPQDIIATQLPCDQGGNPIDYRVGERGVTHIEPCSKSGEYSDIPYLRVWAGKKCLAEFSQHKASFVLFGDGPLLGGGPRKDRM